MENRHGLPADIKSLKISRFAPGDIALGGTF